MSEKTAGTATGKIRKIAEDNGQFLVSLAEHDGYFSVADNELSDFLQGLLRDARDTGAEVSFRYDANLVITEMLL